jgi:hypothetical protein
MLDECTHQTLHDYYVSREVEIALQMCAMELNNSNWTGGLDKSKGTLGWTGGLDKSKVALDVRPHWRCKQALRTY